jgi:hypothetical protein
MQIFNFPYHSVVDKYPESSVVVQFGRGYRFVSKPKGPDQINFILSFPAMWFFVDPVTKVVLNSPEPKRNMQRLIEFYEAHRLYDKFIYPHTRRGNQVVRFLRPLEVPEVEPDSYGKTTSFKLEFILEP